MIKKNDGGMDKKQKITTKRTNKSLTTYDQRKLQTIYKPVQTANSKTKDLPLCHFFLA